MRLFIALMLSLLALPAMAQPTNPLPGVNVKGLDASEVAGLTELLKQGACPCNPQISLQACVVAKTCPEATALGDFGAGKFREGLGLEQVQEAVIRKYLLDHTPKANFDLRDVPFKGDPNGTIIIVEYADFECPHCALMSGIINSVLAKRPKGVKVHFKQFPLGMHPQSERAARATLAAHRQGRFWPMHDLIFGSQGRLTDGSYAKFATELGLNVKKFEQDLADPAIAALVQRDQQEAIAAGLQGTPTLFINGQQYQEEKTPEAIEAYLKRLEKKLGK
jgi:protein-disulfide isomerase